MSRRSVRPARRLVSVAISLVLSAAATSAFADTDTSSVDTPDAADKAKSLPAVQVQGTNKPEARSPKYTAPILDTPQTITVVTNKTIEDQNLLSLRDILSTLPGITFGAGEGGGGYGDSINLRGFSASTDITVDGVRDSAQYSRTDPFNLEQLELVNGANSVYTGVGSVGGSINLVSKAAHLGDSHLATAALGTDNYGRLTLDSNTQIGDNMALRVNVMAHQNDAPGRDFEDYKRWGIAPSFAIGLGSDTTFVLNLLHQHDDNLPQYGVPFYNGGPLPGVDSSNFYGYHNIDKQVIDNDSLTAILSHRFSDNVSIRNLTRVSKVDQVSIVDAPQGVICLPSNVTPTGTSCTVSGVVTPPGFFRPGITNPRGFVRDTSNTALVNQTDINVKFSTGSVEHNMVIGATFARETFELDNSRLFRNADGSVTGLLLVPMDLYNPDSFYTGPINSTLVAKTDGEQDNASIYVFDTLKFNEQWQLNGGLRYEYNSGTSTLYAVSTTLPNIGAITGALAPADNSDSLFSYRAGLVYKPQANASVYLAYGNSKTPSKASVNGTCTAESIAVITAGTANCNVDPESAVNYELGTKWDILGGKLSLTAAIFRNERENYRVADPDPTNVSGEQALDGQARVDGFTFGASGLLADNWSLFANYTYLDSEVIRNVSDYCLANPGVGLCTGGNALDPDFVAGDPLLATPKHSASLWTTYDINRQWQIGYGATYQGEITVQQHSATKPTGELDNYGGYTTHRLMAAYRVNRDFTLQLNINNVTDREYYTRIRNNGWATPGDARSMVLNASYRF
ncbi:MAG: TonB-dependent receptor [Arenimonas sp.]